MGYQKRGGQIPQNTKLRNFLTDRIISVDSTMLLVIFTLALLATSAHCYSDGTGIPCTVINAATVSTTMCNSTVSTASLSVKINGATNFSAGGANTVTVSGFSGAYLGLHVVFVDSGNTVIGTVSGASSGLTTSCTNTAIVHSSAASKTGSATFTWNAPSAATTASAEVIVVYSRSGTNCNWASGSYALTGRAKFKT